MKKSLPFTAMLAAASISLLGCASPPEPEPEREQKVEHEAETETKTEAPAAEEKKSAASGDTPEWFTSVVDRGEVVGEGETESWTIQVFQVGTGKADKDSREVHPETHESLLPAGTEVVYLNFVYTNTSENELNLNAVPRPSVAQADWPFLGGQPGVVTPDLYTEQGLDVGTYDYKLIKQHPETGTIIYNVKPGESIAQAVSVEYEPGAEFEAKLTFTAKDGADEIIDSERQEAIFAFEVE